MITEDYVSFEIAKLLKEKGFDCLCHSYFRKDNPNNLVKETCGANWNDTPFCTSRPTLQMAMKWLREVHGLFISIGNDDLDYNWQIFDIKNRTKDLDPTCLTESYAGYRKYEEACEAAVRYCLENLI